MARLDAEQMAQVQALIAAELAKRPAAQFDINSLSRKGGLTEAEGSGASTSV